MNIYHYHETSGQFIGIGMAEPDPLQNGKWLIPANATTKEPPVLSEGQFAAWNGEKWELRQIEKPSKEQNELRAPINDANTNRAWNGKEWVSVNIKAPPPNKETL